MSFPLTLTEAASAKASSLLRNEGREDMRLRVAVQAGGCSGLIYQTYFDAQLLARDQIQEFGAIEVVVDIASVPYLEGATIGYDDTIENQGFTIDNPNAVDSCACGDSFH